MKEQVAKYSWLLVPLLFLFYTAPGVLDYVITYPDEKHYTDAALQMITTQDYFTPLQADGTPRFLKPIATYWVLAGSYQVFGVSPFSSRVLFWLAGGLLVLVTFLMAKSLTGNKTIAVGASFITAANPLVILSSGRSIPDILLVLFLTLSAWGFLEILIAEHPSKKYYWFAYVSAALAFETKGLPAAAFAGASILYLLLNPWKRKKITQVLEPTSVIFAIVIALGWFIMMYIEHGAEYLSSFYSDQVGERVSSKFLQVLKNAFLGIFTLVVVFTPWIFMALSKPRKLKPWVLESGNKNKAITGFILVWVILIILMSGAVFKFYDRYVLPVVPLSSLLLAGLLVRFSTPGNKFFARLFLILNIVVFCFNLLLIFTNWNTILFLGLFVLLAIFIAWFSGLLKSLNKQVVLANLILLLIFNLFILLQTVLTPNHGKQIAGKIEMEQDAYKQRVFVYGSYSLAANLRVQSKNAYPVIGKNKDYTLPQQNNSHLLVLNAKELNYLDLKNYKVTKAAETLAGLKVENFPEFFRPVISKLKTNKKEYFIAEPKTNEKPQ